MRISTLLLSGCFCLVQLGSVSCTTKQNPNEENNNKRSTPAFLADEPSSTETTTNGAAAGIGNFVKASKAATPAVVHIKTSYGAASSYDDPYAQTYGSPSRGGVAMASGSGVLVTSNGYIATNNHVVENASTIEVVLPDNRQFAAELIGRDPNTDLALIKIKADDLPHIKLGNSDSVQVGEWVVAVGYPFSLNTTVTAGIVSAKARSIGIINRPSGNGYSGSRGNTGIESFIQTDAAINPGNSGGALVNTNGELIGINSAIASQTGSYAGYSFAIPVNLAKKILGDLKEYGSVKRGLLGVSFPSPTAEAQFLQQQGLEPGVVKGVYITGVLDNSAAAAAGLQEGDIVQSIDGLQLNSSSEFSERIARHRPGDVVKLTYLRNNKARSTSATLKGEETTVTAKSNANLDKIYSKLGASFAPVPDALKQRLNLKAGVQVAEVRQGGFFEHIGIPSGTIIAFINGKAIDTPQDIDRALLSAQNGMIQMMAIAPDGSRVVFNFSLGT
ncbi:PDZ domain-containing protein [Hymenobacter taeanensis]|uniref:PDZ domain-containing protein n=1 Tax=Hymenobacter taeanensis TaxID=2735321 RepID=A0A6M6BJ52_9BACT|nr:MULTISPECIES: trypsin-like peptidase domain-containing protein [Hymenobacter]QJX48062.1 PDZ domain-containing protein [Hymenobacter taeanensis]UOQ82485.1 trypsin-like peptidase domain-containing protein [Hymenobacter sp. 5414T-23]